MYKLICANITKSRLNFTDSYKKLAQTKKLHLNGGRSQPVLGKDLVEEELQECIAEDDNGIAETSKTTSSPTVGQKRPSSSKLTSFKTPQTSPWKFREYPRFYTGNVVIPEPPIPSISKKYYHLYSITTPSFSKRPFSDSKLTSNERNYIEAIEDIADIETQKRRNEFQFKPMDLTRFPSVSVNNTKVSKKGKKIEISYPTHTVKHNLTLSKRFRIRQGSADGKLQEMEAKLKKRKLQHKMAWKGMAPKTITYPKLMENVKKTRSNPLDNPPNEQENPKEEAAKVLATNQLSVDQDFESLVKSHPTIEKASNEAKMRLKTKFIQLLLKSSKSANPEPVSKEPEQINVIPENSQKDPECVNMEEDVSKNVKSHPTAPSDIETSKSSYARCRYPKRVWIDNLNISGLNLEEVCIKDSVSKTGSGLITRNYGKETPKPNYEKVEQEAKQLSGFVEKARRGKKLKPNPKSEDATLSGLKQEKLELIKELDKLDVKFAELQGGKDQVDNQSTSNKVRKILTGQMGHEVPPKQPVDLEFEDDLKCEKGTVRGSKEATSPKLMLKHNQQGNKVLEGPKASLYHTDKKVRKTDGILDFKRKPKKCSSESLEPETLGGRHNIDGKPTDTNISQSVRPSRSNKLEEPTKVEELNEQANEKTKTYKKKRKLQKARREFEELQSQIESLPSMKINNITPRIDKTQDRMEEKVEIAEKTKEVIEDIKREASAAVPRKKVVVKNKIMTAKAVSSGTPNIQPRIKRTVVAVSMSMEPSQEMPKLKAEIPKVQEIDVHVKNAQKAKKNLNEFGERKKKEWSEMLAQVFVGSREKEIKDKEELSAPVESTVKDPSLGKQTEFNYPPTEPDAKTNTCKKIEPKETDNQKIKEQPVSGESNFKNKSDGGSFSYSANHADCFKKAKIVFHNVEAVIPIAQESPMQLNPRQNDVTLKVEELVTTMPPIRQSLADLNSPQTVEWLSVTKIVNSAKTTEQNMVPKVVYDKDIQAKQSNKEAKKMALQCQSEYNTKEISSSNNLRTLSPKEALKLFREQVLDKYFDTIVYPTVDQTVYTPKERLIVNDIKEVEKNEKDHCKEMVQNFNDESDSAVIRPGDEIVFVRQDIENHETTNATLKEPSNNLLEDINQNSNVANQLAVMESSILTETKKQIDEIMKKINNLETMFKEQQLSLGEKISGNKVRIPPPPKPPTVLAKDPKDIKKEKPKGPNDIVLPPKVHGPVPDKSPSQDLLQSNTKPATEYKSYVLQDGEQDAISDEQHREKVRKYFVKKFGLTSGSNTAKKGGSASTPALQIDGKCATNESVAKTSKVHKSTCSINESSTKFHDENGSVNLENLESGKLTYWSENRPISCPPVQHKPSKTKTSLRSSSIDTLAQKSRRNDLSKNYLKAKYSTLSGPNRFSQISALPKVMKNIPLVVETNMNKLNWRTTKRSASDDSRGESKDRVKLKSKKSSEQKLEDKPETTKSDEDRVSWSKILKSNSSMAVNKKRHLAKNKSEVIELASTLQSKELCAADANLQQNDPIAVLNVRLTPNGNQIKVTKCSAEKQLLSAKRASSLTASKADLERNSVAGISTTSTLNKSSDKKPRSVNQETEQKNKSGPVKKKEKIAIFRLQPDGEVMIIKKAEDVEKLREKKPKQENKKYIVYLTESQENIPEKKNKSCQSTTVLLAKVEEILVKKPTKKPKAKSFPTNAICDDLNEFFKTETPRITAKIETIYDKQSSVKIRESNRLKQFSYGQEIQRKPRAWKSLFGDVNSLNFGKVKDDFFQQLPSETFIEPQKVGRSKPTIKQPHNIEGLPSTDTLTSAKPENDKPAESLERLNMKYAVMLRNIEKRLAERRRRLEINKEQIEQINKILSLEPECEEPPLTEPLLQKEEPIAKSPTFTNLLRKATKPKISHNVQKDSDKISVKKEDQNPLNLDNLEPRKIERNSVAVEENKIFSKKNLIEETILEVGSPRKNKEVTKPLNEVKPKIYKTGSVNYLNKPKERDNLYKLDVPQTENNFNRNSQYNYLRAPELKNVDIEESKLFAKKILIYDTILEVGKSSAKNIGNNFTTLKELQKSEVVAAPKIPLINEIVVQKNHTQLLNSFKSEADTAKAVEMPQPDILDSVMKEMSRTTVNQPKMMGNSYKLKELATQPKLNTTQAFDYILKVGEPSKANWKSVKVEENQVFAKKSLIDDTVLAEKSLGNQSKTLKDSLKAETITPKITSVSEVLVQQKQTKLLGAQSVKTQKVLLNGGKEEAPKTKSAKGVDVKVSKLSLPMEISQRLTKKYELEKDEQFMSVQKTKMKSSQVNKTDSVVNVKGLKNPPPGNSHIDINQWKRPTTVITPTELEQQARREKLQRSTRKGRAEQNALRQKIKSRKDIVDEINTTAEELRKKQYRKPYETFKGTRRQEMYRHDAKVIQPSVGSCLWGNKLKNLTNSDESKKEFHCSATKNNSDFNRLMSKAEFLELKRRAKNQSTISLQEQEMLYNIREIQKNLTHDFKEDETPKQDLIRDQKNLEQSKSEFHTNTLNEDHRDYSLVPKQTFSEEIYRCLSAKLRTTDNIGQPEDSAEKAHSEMVVPKQLIGDEIYNYLNTQPHTPKRLEKPPSKMQLTERIENELKTINKPMRQLTDDELRFKVTQMAISAAKNVKLDTQDVNIQPKPVEDVWLNTLGSGRTKLEDIAKNEKSFEASSSKVKFELASVDESILNPKTAAEKMADLKRRNKLTRRSQSQDLKNISTPDTTKPENPETSGPGSTCFKPLQRSNEKNKPNNIRTPVSCSKLVLAMRTPQCALRDCCESLDTTLHVTAKSTRLVSLETLKMLKIENKERTENERKVTDRLARYRHLKISYMTVARPRRNKNEKFLPEVVENFEGSKVTEKEKEKILTYRFDLLKRLNNEFQQQLNQQLTTKSPPHCDSSAASQSDMNPTKPALKSDVYDALFSILKAKCTKNKPPPKDGKKGPGGSTRRYCTDSTKCPGDEQEEQIKVNVCNTVVENTKVETSDAKEEQLTPPPKCGFDITEALPKAFENASPQLIKSEQSNLYYRYHKMSFADIHESLADKRTFAVEAAQKKKQEECEKQMKTVSSPKSETES